MKSNNINNEVNNTIEFVYCNKNLVRWRKINAIKEDLDYIYGFDLENNSDYKSFKKSKILGGKIFSFRS